MNNAKLIASLKEQRPKCLTLRSPVLVGPRSISGALDLKNSPDFSVEIEWKTGAVWIIRDMDNHYDACCTQLDNVSNITWESQPKDGAAL